MGAYKDTTLPVNKLTQIGRKVPLFDGVPIVTGKALYSSDYEPRMDNMLHCKLLTSPYAHADIKSVDVSAAMKIPGVEATLTFEEGFWDATDDRLTQRTPTNRARWQGDVVAAVAAADVETAEDAVDAIKVQYSPLSTIFPGEYSVMLDPEKAGRVPIHTRDEMLQSPFASYYPYMIFSGTSNSTLSNPEFVVGVGDVDAGFKQAEVTVERTYHTQKHRTNLWEPTCAIAQWLSDGRLQLIESSQTPYINRMDVAKSLNTSPLLKGRKMDPLDVQIIMEYTGGAMGTRATQSRYDCIAALLSLKTGKPVMIELTREEMIRDHGGRPASEITAKIGAKKDGTVTAIDAKLYWDVGAHLAGQWTIMTGAEAYMRHLVTANARWQGWWLYSNSFGSYIRSYGAPQGFWAFSQLVDELCDKLGMDPVSFYLKNSQWLQPDDVLKKELPAPDVVGSIRYPNAMRDCITKTADAIGWSNRTPWNTKTGRYRRGLGFAVNHTYGYATANPDQGGDEAWVEISPNGVVTVKPGESNDGTFRFETLAKVVAEVLKIPYESVQIIKGDTDKVGIMMGQFASSQCHVGGSYYKRAAEEIRDRLLAEAATILKVDVNTLDLKDGVVFVSGSPNTKISFAEVAQAVGTLIVKKRYLVYHDRNGGFADAADVEVDTETGRVRVIKIVYAADIGKAINPTVVIQQMEGGANSLSFGMSVSEDFVLDPQTGYCLTTSNHEHKLPTIVDVAEQTVVIPIEITTDLTDWDHTVTGIGEMSTACTAPIISNAIFNATGARVFDAPITPDKVLKALKAVGGS